MRTSQLNTVNAFFQWLNFKFNCWELELLISCLSTVWWIWVNQKGKNRGNEAIPSLVVSHDKTTSSSEAFHDNTAVEG